MFSCTSPEVMNFVALFIFLFILVVSARKPPTKISPCDALKTWNYKSNSCMCKFSLYCDTGMEWSKKICACVKKPCTTICTKGKYLDNNCQCVCEPIRCNLNDIFNNETCLCDVQPSTDSCGSWQKFDSSLNKCVCKETFNCLPGYEFDDYFCDCLPVKPSCSLICGERELLDEFSCSCKKAPKS